MRSLTDDDLVYFIIKVLVAPTDVSKVLQIDQYIVSTELGPSHKRGGPRPWNARSVTPELDYTTLAMTIDPDSMKHPSRGHLLGSDSSDCDVLLDTTNANGISGVHFQLDLVFGEEQPQMLWIVDMSAEATLETEQAQLSYGQQRALKPRSTNRVQAGLVVFDIVSADRRFEPAVLRLGMIGEVRAGFDGVLRLVICHMCKWLDGGNIYATASVQSCAVA
ncbi:hypothetical protein LTR12_012399 [Friedmanniomyces endolithicus]|nr:hypothetical protein LTR12_012399 [Friedmanniomyces endolithicus]